jgi:hypothetical protein
MRRDPRPNANTIELYRQLPNDALIVLQMAFELDWTRPDLSTAARRFIRGRLTLIHQIITERTQYLHD